jgi:uncharacterized protein YuzE
METTPAGFELSVTAREDGSVEAVYIRFDRGKVASTREVQSDVVFADYDEAGRLLGIELLGPTRVSVLARLVDQSRRESFRRFVRESLPPVFCAAA